MSPFGLKWSRFSEFLSCLKAERRTFALFPFLRSLYQVTRSPVSSTLYRQRLRICSGCPVYNPVLRQCRRGPAGCGCYMPYKALSPEACWINQRDSALGYPARSGN